MAVEQGVNAGIVSEVPTSDPTGSGDNMSDNAVAIRTSAPSDCTITEMGWYCGNATQEANFEVGIYIDDGDEPDTLMDGVSRTNAKGTSAGWKTVTGLNIALSNGVTYWLAVQCDDTDTLTLIDYSGEAGEKQCLDYPPVTTLPPTFSTQASYDNYINAIYAYAGAPPTPYTSINIGDEWKSMSGQAIKINIGDAWKDVAAMKLNVADAWKPIVIA